MKITQTLYAPDRKTWRRWLKQHYRTEKEIWLIYYRKQTGRGRISYNDAVEEALCFGWIDSTVKTLDAERLVQKFSPRRAKSAYSQTNKERLQRLVARGKVMKDVLANLGEIAVDKFKIPADIRQAFQANKVAWKNFKRYAKSYQRIRVAYVDSARKRPGQFEKRLHHLIKMTEQNKQFGHGIETYY